MEDEERWGRQINSFLLSQSPGKAFFGWLSIQAKYNADLLQNLKICIFFIKAVGNVDGSQLRLGLELG